VLAGQRAIRKRTRLRRVEMDAPNRWSWGRPALNGLEIWPYFSAWILHCRISILSSYCPEIKLRLSELWWQRYRDEFPRLWRHFSELVLGPLQPVFRACSSSRIISARKLQLRSLKLSARADALDSSSSRRSMSDFHVY
jgi:hypothetical protein